MTVAPYKDSNVTHDHTYYGRGCKNSYGTGGEGGSQTPCADSDAGGRYTNTADNESQKNGTYFNLQAASSGAGSAISTDNTNSPDTFCPLGWQMPYAGTGGDYYDKSRSWTYLFTTYNIKFNGTTTDAGKVKSYPFSYIYSGQYFWATGRLYDQTTNGFYQSSTIVNSERSYRMATFSPGILTNNTTNKAGGFPIR